jgi:hypothetical protein
MDVRDISKYAIEGKRSLHNSILWDRLDVYHKISYVKVTSRQPLARPGQADP